MSDESKRGRRRAPGRATRSQRGRRGAGRRRAGRESTHRVEPREGGRQPASNIPTQAERRPPERAPASSPPLQERSPAEPVASERRTRREAVTRVRRKRMRKRAGIGSGVVVAGIVAVLVVGFLIGREVVSNPQGSDANPPPPGSASTMLLVGTSPPKAEPVWMAVVHFDERADEGAFVYLPAHTAAEVPGRGLASLGVAHAVGGDDLLSVSVESLLGIDLDGVVELSEQGSAELFATTGPLTVEIPAAVKIPAEGETVRIVLPEGTQELDPAQLVATLFTIGLEGDDVELGSRHLALWDSLLDKFSSDPAALATAIVTSSESSAPSDEVATLFEGLAGLQSEGRDFAALPVSQASVGASELYSFDEDENAQFVGDTLAGAVSGSEATRLQILNGNGVPGIGQKVAERLVGEGYKVVLSGNARKLNYPKTLVIIYEDTPANRALAERTRELLGVGEIQISSQGQGIVDMTIVVGRDFPRRS